MNAPTPEMRPGDYATRHPADTLDARTTARQAMRRNGCRSIRFEITDAGALVAHGYVGRFEGQNVEDL